VRGGYLKPDHPRSHHGRLTREGAQLKSGAFWFSLLSADDQVVFEGVGVKKAAYPGRLGRPPMRYFRLQVRR
jgi:hypothetical protein